LKDGDGMSCKYSDNVMCSDRAMCKGCPCEEVAKSMVIELMTELSRKGIETDFLYEKDGQNGYWLEVVKGQVTK